MRLFMLDDDPVEFLPNRAIDDHNDVRGRTRLVPQRLQRSIELVGDDAVVDGHENREVSDGGHVSLEPWELQGDMDGASWDGIGCGWCYSTAKASDTADLAARGESVRSASR